MGIAPEEGWAKRHPAASTIIVILLIALIGAGLKVIQVRYFPAEKQEYINPVFINESFAEVDSHFNLNSNVSEAEQDALFSSRYRYNIFNWTCRPINCRGILGKPTMNLVCKEQGFTEDVRIAMDTDCADAAKSMQVTVLFQLMTRTTGEYYLGRSGKIVG